jgi:hypothetical protein
VPTKTRRHLSKFARSTDEGGQLDGQIATLRAWVGLGSISTLLGGTQQSHSLSFGQAQPAHEQLHGTRARSLFDSTLEITDAAPAQPGPLGQLLLGQAKSQPVLTEQLGEGRVIHDDES